MRHLTMSETATALHVAPSTVRGWERRFGFPMPQRSPGNHRVFMHSEVVALELALRQSSSVSAAISRVREGLAVHDGALVGALDLYDGGQADIEIEAALGLRSVERSVDEVLLPALEHIVQAHTVDSAAWAFAAHWGGDWLRRATRMAMPPVRPVSILLGDASRDELDRDSPHIRALELFCVRAGVKLMSLSVRGVSGMREVIAAHCPDLVVLAGGNGPSGESMEWTDGIRQAAISLPIMMYRHEDPRDWLQGSGAGVLPSGASDAHLRLLELVELEQLRTAPKRRQPGAVKQLLAGAA